MAASSHPESVAISEVISRAELVDIELEKFADDVYVVVINEEETSGVYTIIKKFHVRNLLIFWDELLFGTRLPGVKSRSIYCTIPNYIQLSLSDILSYILILAKVSDTPFPLSALTQHLSILNLCIYLGSPVLLIKILCHCLYDFNAIAFWMAEVLNFCAPDFSHELVNDMMSFVSVVFEVEESDLRHHLIDTNTSDTLTHEHVIDISRRLGIVHPTLLHMSDE